MARIYRDFFVSIEQGKVEGRFAGAREAADLEMPVTAEEVEVLWEGKGRVEEIGNRLYNAVFSRKVLELLRTAKNRLLPWEGLRLRFEIKWPGAFGWPLETLHDERRFLALQKNSLIVRHQGPLRKLWTLWAFPPLRLLVVVAIPNALERLDAEEELNAIQDALEPLRRRRRVEVDHLDNPTFAALSDRLDGTYHVLHFIGHGGFDRNDGGGRIYLTDTSGAAQAVEGTALAALLGLHSSLRLVVLNTCEGAVARGDRFLGVAQALIQQGIPAVLAMQGKISDPNALRFSRRFYERLAKGRPVDRALRKARQEMFVAEPGRADWAMPVLFLGSKNGWLFAWLPSRRFLLGLSVVLFLVAALLWIKPWKPRCPTPKAVDMELVWIEPTPGSKITKPFCLGKFEVSRAEWRSVMGANSLPKGEEGGDDLPAGVSESNTQKFLRKLNEKEGKDVHRLPTDAEWEHAAMGSGNSQGGNCKEPDGYEGLAPVGSFRTNDWGLYDMVGNVWEWVAAPDVTGKQRVRRGGSWESAQGTCKATARKLVLDRNLTDTGFRVLREIPDK